MKLHRKRLFLDRSILTGVSLVSLIGLLILMMIFLFVFSKGAKMISWNLLSGDYYSQIYDSYYEGALPDAPFEKPAFLGEEIYFSSRWGIGFSDAADQEGKKVILIEYVAPLSPLASLPDKNNEGEMVTIYQGQMLEKVIFSDNTMVFPSHGAQLAASRFDQAEEIRDLVTATSGKGIRGSIITTVLLIVLTLAIAVPLGVFSAIYLHEFAPKNNKIVIVLRRLIEMLSGMPSIIFGLMGAAVFIPFTAAITQAEGGNLISGALTLSIIVLPTLISSTEEALRVVPEEWRQASLALGASKTQTTFKVVLRGAVPGILTGTLLAIGRIIGESAALIYAVGTAIKDQIFLTERSTTLAVHIWSVMSGEVPNFEMASAISLIILAVVLVLSLLVKLIAHKYVIDPSVR